jgi:hypothetical protein
MLLGTTAYAVEEEAEGGTWCHGFKCLWTTVYSDYLHPNYIHGSLVDGAWFDSDYNKPKGTWSRVSADAGVCGNKAYYCIGERE